MWPGRRARAQAHPTSTGLHFKEKKRFGPWQQKCDRGTISNFEKKQKPNWIQTTFGQLAKPTSSGWIQSPEYFDIFRFRRIIQIWYFLSSPNRRWPNVVVALETQKNLNFRVIFLRYRSQSQEWFPENDFW